MLAEKDEKQTSNIVFIRMSDGKNHIYDYRYELRQSGFEFNKRSKNNSFYELKTTNDQVGEWEKFAKRNKLRCDAIPEQYMRSADYRKDFFKVAQPAQPAKYRCAYCGRKLIYQDVTVDHIIPVNKMSYNKATRRMAKRLGIDNVNDVKNLVAACRSCNSKKGTKMGKWLYRGFLGKFETLWKIRIGLRWTIATAAAIFIVYGFNAVTGFDKILLAGFVR